MHVIDSHREIREEHEVDIGNFEEFCQTVDTTALEMDRISCDAQSILSNVQSEVENVSNALNLLNAVSSKYRPDGMARLEINDHYLGWAKDIASQMQIKVGAVCLYIIAAKNRTSDFTSNDAAVLVNAILQKTVDFDLYWIIAEAVKKTCPELSGIASLFAYGTDLTNADGIFLAGDYVGQPVGHLVERIFGKVKLNAEDLTLGGLSGGMAAAGLFVMSVDVITDRGEFTNKDKLRTGLDVGGAALCYGEWVLVAAAAGGGVPGVVAATLVGIPTSMIFSAMKDGITGDETIYTYKYQVFNEDGSPALNKKGKPEFKSIDIPANGNGKNGTWDCLVQESDEKFKENVYTIDGVKYSTSSVNSVLYNRDVAVDLLSARHRENEMAVYGAEMTDSDEYSSYVNAYYDVIDNIENDLSRDQFDDEFCKYSLQTNPANQDLASLEFDPYDYYCATGHITESS